ncbi:MAG TPA: enoyl-CoA hydratase [Usitatibacter sp.]|nr:enoyl-CoA hydratase [Usitatibacter sp.]
MTDIVATRRDAVLGIGINRPQKRNALTQAMYAAMTEHLAQAERDESVRAVLFHGLADVFTAGNDLEDFAERPPHREETPVFHFLHAVAAAQKPLVAAVTGPAVGIGTTLLFHCDLVYAADNARFALPFVQLGLVPEFASSYLLPLLAGYQRAAELLLLGETFDAKKAYETGFVTRVVPAAEAIDTGWREAAKLAALPPKSVRVTKALMKSGHAEAVRGQLAAEGEHFRTMLTEPAARAAFAAFLARRK